MTLQILRQYIQQKQDEANMSSNMVDQGSQMAGNWEKKTGRRWWLGNVV